MDRVHYRTVWISDAHLGSRGCRAAELAAFLKRIECEHLYLVGDIVDFWRLRRRSAHWPPECTEVLRRVLKLVKRGARLVVIPGKLTERGHHTVHLRRPRIGDQRDRETAVHSHDLPMLLQTLRAGVR